MSIFVETAIKSLHSHPYEGPLPSEKYLFERLEREAELSREQARRRAHARAWELAKQQGVEPVHNIEDLYGNFWPEEESVDDFLAWLRANRQEDKTRNLPE